MREEIRQLEDAIREEDFLKAMEILTRVEEIYGDLTDSEIAYFRELREELYALWEERLEQWLEWLEEE